MENWEKIWKDAGIHTTMHELLERTRQCEGTALDVCGEVLSYKEFHERSDLFAAWLQHQGYGPDEAGVKRTVILSMKASADLFCMIAACLKAGVIVTVTEDDVTNMRLRKLCEQTKAIARITDSQIREISEGGNDLPLKKMTDRFRPEDVYAIWYTSGSTGEPCGIQTMSYNTVCNIVPVPGNEIMSTCLKECSALLSISHPSFGVGFTNFFYAILYGKKFVHIQTGRENSIRKIAQKITQNKDCFLLFTPSAVSACLRDEEAKRSFANCRAVMMGADVVKSSLIQEVQDAMGPGGKVINLYGISDVGLVAAKIAREDDRPHAIGKPTACTQITAVDENRNPLAPGEPGELCIYGIRVGPGYLSAEPEKMNKFVHGKDGVNRFYSGDYGYVDEEGEVFLLGRTDRLIKHMGYRVDGVEVEEVIRRQAHVKGVAVKQFETGKGQVLCAFYENDEELDPAWIRSCISGILPRYCIPERFIFRKVLPLTERGKLDYRALALTEEDQVGESYEAPRTEKERMLCEAFEACLKTGRPVGRNESFFELGGDSVTGMLLMAYLGKKHGLHITMDELFFNPKPCDLCNVSGVSEEAGTDRAAGESSLTLPDELMPLAESAETEAVFPADAASSLYLFLQESGSAYRRGLTLRFRVRLLRSFREAEFRERCACLMKRHPSLRSHFIKDASGKRWQIFDRVGKPVVYYRDLSGMSESARERFLSGFFHVMDENDALFQAACFPAEDGSCDILVGLMHALSDGMSAMILVNELAGSQDPSGTDAFYEYRQRVLAKRDHFPQELQDYYADFRGRMRLPIRAGTKSGCVERREITLTMEQTQMLKAGCGNMGISLATYVEYCYGKGLLAAMNREDVWFSHLYSGRDYLHEDGSDIVGNLFYTMPVHLHTDMSVSAFRKELIKPWKYPYITETNEYRQLNRHMVEEGIVSRILIPFHENVVSFISVPDRLDTGHYMETAEGNLRIVFRYPEEDLLGHAYDTIAETMTRLLNEPGPGIGD